MKKMAVFLLTIASFKAVFSMNNQVQPFQLHQPMCGYLDHRLRTWLLNMIYRQRVQPVAPVSIFNCAESSMAMCKIALTSDGHTAIIASEDNIIRIWDIPRNTCSHRLVGHTGPIIDIKIIQGRNLIVTISQDSTARIWDLRTGACLHILTGHTGSILDVALTPDGATAITRSSDNTARIWDIASGACRCTLNCNPETLHQALVTPDGNTAITRSDIPRSWYWRKRGLSYVCIWDTKTGTIRYDLPVVLCNKIEISPNGQTLITRDTWSNSAWEIATGIRHVIYHINEHDCVPEDGLPFIPQCAFGPHKSAILIFKKYLTILNLESGAEQNLSTGGYFIKSITVSPDENIMAGCSDKNTLHVWNFQTGKNFMLDEAEPNFSLDSSMAMPTADRSFWRWPSFGSYPTMAQINESANTAITVSQSHTFVWNLPTGTMRCVLPNPFSSYNGWNCGTNWFKRRKAYNNLVMNPNGTCLAAVTADGCTIQAWNIAQQEPGGALENLSVFQIALLTEILHRTQTRGQRLLLRPGSNNHAAYQALHPIIRNVVRPYIGIYRPAHLDDFEIIER